MGSPFSSQSILHDVEENHKKQIAAHNLRGEKGAKVGHYFLTLFLQSCSMDRVKEGLLTV